MAGVEKHMAEASAASTSRVFGMRVDLWAVACPAVAPCGGRDEVVKVTKLSAQHVRMKLTELYRLQNQIATKSVRKSLILNKNMRSKKIRSRRRLKILCNLYTENQTCLTLRAHARPPKMAVPMRTSVAPSAIASGKSPLMPIESRGRTCPSTVQRSRSSRN